ncbi:MAG: tetratricopeptide repeat protein [Gammaproteobacteria bacterium]
MNSSVTTADEVSLAENNVPVRVQEAEALYQSGKIEEAIGQLQTIVDSGVESAEAFHTLGVILIQQNRFDDGVDLLKRAIEIEPENIRYRMDIAKAFDFKGMSALAIDAFKAVVRLAEAGSADYVAASKKIEFIEANVFARQGNFGEALPRFQTLAEKYPDDMMIQYSLGLANMLTNNVDAAEQAFGKAVALSPEYADAYFYLASMQERKGNVQQAIKNFNKVVEINPKAPISIKARVKLGLIEGTMLARQGSVRDGLDILLEVLKLDPENLVALLAVSEFNQQLGKIADAEAGLRKIIELAPRHLEARFRLAGIYASTDRLANSIEQLEYIVEKGAGSPQAQRAQQILQRITASQQPAVSQDQQLEQMAAQLQSMIEAEPDKLELRIELGRVLLRQNKLAEAQVLFEFVAEHDPDNKLVQLTLATIYDDFALYDKSIERYSKVIALEKNKQDADKYIGLLSMVKAKKLFVEDKLGEAQRAFTEIIDENPENVLAHFYIGLINSREENMLKAVDAFEEVLRMVPGHSGARLNLAMGYERLNREEEAISEYRKLLQSKAPKSLLDSAKDRLFAAEKRIHGLTTSSSYMLSYDGNSNQSNDNPSQEFRSDLSVNMAYQHKLKNGLRLRASISPVYSNYHVGQFDFLNTSASLSATLLPKKYRLVGGYTNRLSEGLLNETRFSRSHVLFAEGSTRLKLPRITSPLSAEKVGTGVSTNLSVTSFDSESSPFFSAITSSIGASVNQQMKDNSALTFSYTFTHNKNKEDVGRDYAYNGHAFNVRYERRTRRIMRGLVANASYGLNHLRYVNPDSFSRFTAHRRNTSHNFTLGGSYQVHKKLRVLASLSYSINTTNLPIGFVLNTQDVIEGQQSTSLGDYKRLSTSVGVSMSF